MHPNQLTSGTVYNYTKLDGTIVPLKYWYEQLNYWVFTQCEQGKTVLLNKQQIINNLTEI